MIKNLSSFTISTGRLERANIFEDSTPKSSKAIRNPLILIEKFYREWLKSSARFEKLSRRFQVLDLDCIELYKSTRYTVICRSRNLQI